MKLKILTALFLSAAMTVVSPLKTKAEEGCSNYPFKPLETKFIALKDGLFKLYYTEETQLSSGDYEEVGLALFESELMAEIALKQFIATEVDEKKDLDFDQILSQKVYGIIKVGSCYEPNKYVRVTLGLSPNTIKVLSEDFPYSKNRSPMNLP